MAQVNEVGGLVGRIFGNVPGFLQHSGRGELYGVLQLLRHCLPPIVIVTDYENFIEGFEKGPHWCSSPKQKSADLIQWVKVAAHTSYLSVISGRVEIGMRAQRED